MRKRDYHHTACAGILNRGPISEDTHQPERVVASRECGPLHAARWPSIRTIKRNVVEINTDILTESAYAPGWVL